MNLVKLSLTRGVAVETTQIQQNGKVVLKLKMKLEDAVNTYEATITLSSVNALIVGEIDVLEMSKI